MRGKGCSPIARASGLTSRTQCKTGLRREIRCKGEGEGVGVREQTRVVDEWGDKLRGIQMVEWQWSDKRAVVRQAEWY